MLPEAGKLLKLSAIVYSSIDFPVNGPNILVTKCKSIKATWVGPCNTKRPRMRHDRLPDLCSGLAAPRIQSI